jgi:hypothetical protein
MNALIRYSRGKKFLRRFDDEEGEDDDNMSDLEIRRRAGVSPNRRLTRSTIKPRILFPTEEQVRARNAAAEEADEEAVTDIEVPCPTTVKAGANGPATKSTANHKNAPVSPATAFRTPSPPPTDPGGSSGTLSRTARADPTDPTSKEPKPTNKHIQRPKSGRSVSPFDSWSRVKHSGSTGDVKSAAKRRGSPLEKTTKRVRSGGQGPSH